ncbi:MAG: hypothetical protein HKN41_09355, partial [Ilumatobacter sp.]|nr:hypothetical protein [Ilumatobacter sp.]
MSSMIRTRWAAIGAAIAVTLGGVGIGLVSATAPPSATAFVPITACRVMDTRPAPDTVGPRSAPLGAGDTHTVTVHGDNGNCTGIPASATAVQLNVTAVDASTLTFLTLWAAGDDQPDASSLNPSPGQPPTPNAVTTALNSSGQFNIFNKFGSVNVLADINGYYVVDTDDSGDDAWGYIVGSNGGLHASSGNVRTIRIADGHYCAFVSERPSWKATMATIAETYGTYPALVTVDTGHGNLCFAQEAPGEQAIPIEVFDGSGTRFDADVTFWVPT